MRRYAPGDAGYTIHEPDEAKRQAATAAAHVISRLFDTFADLHRRELERERFEAESRQRREEFAAEMEKLAQQFERDHEYALNFQNGCFQLAQQALAEGDAERGLGILQLLANAPRKTLVQELIAYHERVTFGPNR